MIHEYFSRIESVLQKFPNISSYTIKKKVYGARQGVISASIVFGNDYSLYFTEVKDTSKKEKIKYRYQFMDENRELIFRYDNAYHHKNIKTYPHHKHDFDNVKESPEPDLEEVLLEIAQIHRKTT